VLLHGENIEQADNFAQDEIIDQENEVNQIGCGNEEEELPSFRTIYDQTKTNDKFKIAHRNIRIGLNSNASLLSVTAALSDIVNEERARDTPNDFFGFTINSDTGGKEIQVEFKRRSQVQVDDISLAFESVVQSNDQFLLGTNMDVEVVTVQDSHGKGKEKDNYKKLSANNNMIDAHPISDTLKIQFGLFGMTYKNVCLLVAINVAIEHHIYTNSAKTTPQKSAWKSARRQNTKKFVEGVQKLYKKCKIDFSKGATHTIIREVEAALDTYRLVSCI
jgi:hypothetical protein